MCPPAAASRTEYSQQKVLANKNERSLSSRFSYINKLSDITSRRLRIQKNKCQFVHKKMSITEQKEKKCNKWTPGYIASTDTFNRPQSRCDRANLLIRILRTQTIPTEEISIQRTRSHPLFILIILKLPLWSLCCKSALQVPVSHHRAIISYIYIIKGKKPNLRDSSFASNSCLFSLISRWTLSSISRS